MIVNITRKYTFPITVMNWWKGRVDYCFCPEGVTATGISVPPLRTRKTGKIYKTTIFQVQGNSQQWAKAPERKEANEVSTSPGLLPGGSVQDTAQVQETQTEPTVSLS